LEKNAIDQIWKKCKTSDRKSQSLLYHHFAPRMYALCLRYAGSTLEAEDMLQTGFIKIFDRHDQYDERGSLEGWMKRIMINNAIELLRKNKMSFFTIDDNTEAQFQSGDMGYDPTEYQDLIQLIKGLPVGYRTVFNMYVIEGYSHKEIAELLHTSEGNSKSQLSRARTWLKGKLNKTEELKK